MKNSEYAKILREFSRNFSLQDAIIYLNENDIDYLNLNDVEVFALYLEKIGDDE